MAVLQTRCRRFRGWASDHRKARGELPDHPEASLSRLVSVIRQRWLVLLLIFVPISAGVAAYAQSLPATYQSIAVLTFTPKPQAQVGGDTLRLVLPKYVVFAGSTGELIKASKLFGISRADLEQNTEVSVPAETANLRIAVTLDNPRLARRVAALLARDTLVRSRSDPLLTAQSVQEADVPNGPAGPNRNLYRIAGVFAGLVLGLGALTLSEGLRPRVLTALEAGAISGFDVWAAVPALSRTGERDPLDDPEVSGSLRSIRNHLLRRWKATAARPRAATSETIGRAVVVTSPARGQGTTTIATLLVRSMSRMGYRVLAVDAHLDQPDLATRLGLTARTGLADVLAGTTDLAEHPATPGEVVVIGGDREAEEALGWAAEQLFDLTAGHFDVIVVDAPALTEGDAAQDLAVAADDVVFVVGRRGSQAALSEASGLLRELHVTPGLVANRVGPRPIS